MADDLATDAAAQSDELAELRDQVQASYDETGLSDKTRQLLTQYVDKVVQASGLPVSSSSLAERDRVEDIAASLDLGVSDQRIFDAIEVQLASVAEENWML